MALWQGKIHDSMHDPKTGEEERTMAITNYPDDAKAPRSGWHGVTEERRGARVSHSEGNGCNGRSDVVRNEPLNEAMQPSETPLELPARVVTARLVRGAFLFPTAKPQAAPHQHET